MRRSNHRLLRGFWEFPSTELRGKGRAARIVVRLALENHGLAVESVKPLMTVKHSITTRRIELQVFQAKLVVGTSAKMNDPNCRWVRLKEMDQYAFASASQRIVEELSRVAEAK